MTTMPVLTAPEITYAALNAMNGQISTFTPGTIIAMATNPNTNILWYAIVGNDKTIVLMNASQGGVP
jgi:hypothetical protein